MEVVAQSQSVRISPRKARIVAQAIRRHPAVQALNMLSLIEKRGASVLSKTLKSAIANAVNNSKLNENTLVIKSIEITEAPSLKRFHPSTRGRTHPYKKRGSHIRIILEEEKK